MIAGNCIHGSEKSLEPRETAYPMDTNAADSMCDSEIFYQQAKKQTDGAGEAEKPFGASDVGVGARRDPPQPSTIGSRRLVGRLGFKGIVALCGEPLQVSDVGVENVWGGNP